MFGFDFIKVKMIFSLSDSSFIMLHFSPSFSPSFCVEELERLNRLSLKIVTLKSPSSSHTGAKSPHSLHLLMRTSEKMMNKV